MNMFKMDVSTMAAPKTLDKQYVGLFVRTSSKQYHLIHGSNFDSSIKQTQVSTKYKNNVKLWDSLLGELSLMRKINHS